MNTLELKGGLIEMIAGINNELVLQQLFDMVAAMVKEGKTSLAIEQKTQLSPHHSSPPIVDIRENVSLDELVAEQQTVPISYSEIETLANEGEWAYPLTELIEALN